MMYKFRNLIEWLIMRCSYLIAKALYASSSRRHNAPGCVTENLNRGKKLFFFIVKFSAFVIDFLSLQNPLLETAPWSSVAAVLTRYLSILILCLSWLMFFLRTCTLLGLIFYQFFSPIYRIQWHPSCFWWQHTVKVRNTMFGHELYCI